MNNALIALLQSLDIQYADQLIPGRGIFHCPTTGNLIIHYRREGVPGEFTLHARVEFSPPWVNPNTVLKENADG